MCSHLLQEKKWQEYISNTSVSKKGKGKCMPRRHICSLRTIIRSAATLKAFHQGISAHGWCTHHQWNTSYFNNLRMMPIELNIGLWHTDMAQDQEKVWEYLHAPHDAQEKSRNPRWTWDRKQKWKIISTQHSWTLKVIKDKFEAYSKYYL